MADGVVIFDVELDSSGLSGQLGGLGSKLAKGAAVAAAGAAVGKGLSEAIGAGMNFESIMSKVKALSDATDSQMAELTQSAKDWGASTAFSASEVGQAFTYMAQAGWDTSSMLAGIGPILNLAAADGLDLATTSDIVTDSLTAFGLTAGDTAMYADVLATAAAASNTNVHMMGETFKYAAPVAGALGYSVQDVALAVGLMANAGIKGSQAGTALRGVLTRMAKPTKQSQQAMDALGVSLSNADGTMKPLSQVMGELREGFAGMTAEQQASYAAMLAGQEGMSGLLAIVNASEEEYNKLADAIANSEGSAERMAKTMMDNLAGDVEEFKGAAETLALEFYETFSDSLRKAVQTGTSIIDKLTEGLKEGDLSGAFADIFTNDFPKIANTIGTKLGEALAGLPALLEEGGDTTNALLTGLLASGKALAEGLTSGIGESLPEYLPKLASSLISGLGTAFSSLPEYADAATNLISGLANSLVGVEGSEIASSLNELATDIASGLSSSFQNIPELATAATNLMSGLTNALVGAEGEGVSTAVSTLASTIGQGLSTALANLPELLTSGATLLTELGKGALAGAADFVSGLVTGIGDEFPNHMEGLAQAFVTALSTAISALPDLAVSIGEIIGSLAKALGEGLAGLVEGSYEGTESTLVQNLSNIAKALVDGLAAALPGIADGFAALGTALLNGIKNTFVGADGTGGIAGELAQSLIDGINDFFTLNFPGLDIKLPSWSEIVAASGEALSSITTGLKETLKALVEIDVPDFSTIKGKFDSLVQSIKDFFTQAFTGFWENVFGGGGEGGEGVEAGEGVGQGLLGLLVPEANAAELPPELAQANEAAATLAQQDMQRALVEAFQNGEISYADLVAAAFGGGEGLSIEEQMAAITEQMTLIGGQMKAALIAGFNGGGEAGGEGAEGGAATDQMTTLGSQLAQAVATGISNGSGNISSEMKSAIDSAKNAVNIQAFVNLGLQISQGVARGIKQGSGAIALALIAAIKNALAEGLAAAEIHSPSRLFRDELGRWIPAGAAEGIEMNAWQMREATRQMVLDSVPSLNGFSRRVAAGMDFGFVNSRLAHKAYMAGFEPVQEINFNVPVQTPDEFAQTVELFMTYGLEADF